ncbi:MAG: putative metalloprotease CJM1_0395 family protein [bacterium]
MTIEPYANGFSTELAAVTLRPSGLLRSTAAISAVQQSSVCPKCGRSGYDCCEYDDRIMISPEGQAKSMALASPQDLLKTAPQDSGQQSTESSDSTKRSDDTPSSLTSVAVDPITKEEAGTESGTGGDSSHDKEKETLEQGHESASTVHDGELSEDEQKEVDELKNREQEVRQHEMAHKSAAGQLAVGGPNYTYETGPDGKQYATSGEVKIAVGSGQTPEEKLHNAQQAARAALAPSEPSGEDRQIAAEAQRVAMEAQQELNQDQSDETGQAADSRSTVAAHFGTKPTDQIDKQDGQETSLAPSSTSPTQADNPEKYGHEESRDVSESDDTPLARTLARVADSYRQQTTQHSRTVSLGDDFTSGGRLSLTA